VTALAGRAQPIALHGTWYQIKVPEAWYQHRRPQAWYHGATRHNHLHNLAISAHGTHRSGGTIARYIEPGIVVADLVIIPTRPSAFDIEQAGIIVELCEIHGKPHAFVFNQADPGTKLTRSAVQYLQDTGGR
jgi:hypothetical protein